MKFIKQDLLTLLIGLFLFSACKSTNSIGLEPDDADAIQGDMTVLAVNASTVTDDPASSLGLNKYPLGYISDDKTFGSTEASLALSISLPSSGYSFGSDPIVDSAVLVLPYYVQTDSSKNSRFYGDTVTSKYSFNVQQLEEDLTLQKGFLSNKEWAVKAPVIGNFPASKLRPNTRPTITDLVPGKADTSRQVPTGQIRIRLDKDFIQQNILNLDSATRSKNSKFTGSFKGLKISVNKTASTGTGGIAFLDFALTDELARANISIYYRKLQDNSVVQRDTATVFFPVASAPIGVTTKHDYTGTPVKEQLDVPNPAKPYNFTYLQAGGLRNKISFPDIKKFTDSVKGSNSKAKVVITRAELVVNLSNGTDVAPFLPAERLSLYRLDVAGQRTNLTDNLEGIGNVVNPRYAGSPQAFGGYYDKKNKRYVFVVTAYLQELIDGTTQDYGTFLAPTTYSLFSITPALGSAERSVISSRNPVTGDKAIKLNVYYTKAD